MMHAMLEVDADNSWWDSLHDEIRTDVETAQYTPYRYPQTGGPDLGKSKKIDRIAGCLIACACRESHDNGHEGFMFLTPKTGLIEHYASKYGLIYTPAMGSRLTGLMSSNSKISHELVKEYLDSKK